MTADIKQLADIIRTEYDSLPLSPSATAWARG
jgi:hypothetical protein